MERIGPYVVVNEIGRGGAGVVMRCRAPDGGDVAVKVLLDPRKNSLLARFARERQLLDELAEEGGFVPLLDAGESPRGPYLVMPFVPGGTLRQRLATGALSLSEALELVTTLAEAVGRAHARGIVHRDLKPENVLFTIHGAPLVTDLGLAKHFADSSPGTAGASLSKTGELRGTVGYMAPEQIRSAKDVGPPADVFALGAILHECLTRRPAFVGESVTEVMTRVLEGSRESVRSLAPDTPRWVSDLVDRALAKDEAARFGDGAELATAIEDGLRGQGGGRPRGVLLAAAVGALAVALVAGVALARRGDEPTATPGPAPVASVTPPPPAPSTEATIAAVPSLVVTGQLGSTWLRHPKTVTAMAVGLGATPDQEVAFFGDSDGLVWVWRVPQGEFVTSFTAFPADREPIRAIYEVNGSAKGALVLGIRRGLVFARPNGGGLTNLTGHRTPIVAAATAWKTSLCASVDEGGRVFVIDLARGRELMNVDCSTDPPTALAFLPDDTTLLVGLSNGEIIPVSLEAKKALPRLFAAKPPIRALAVSPEGDRVVVSRRDGPPVVVHLGTRTPTNLEGIGSASVIAFGAGGKLFGAIDDGSVFECDVAVGPERLAKNGSRAAPGLGVLADGRALFLSEPSGQPRLLGEPMDEGHEGIVTTLLPLPGGRLASSGADRTVRLWDLATGRELACAREHTDVVLTLAAGPDGAFVSGSRDGTVVTHDAGTGGLRSRSKVPSFVERVCVTADGITWAATRDGLMRVDGQPGPATASSGGVLELAAVGDLILTWDREGMLVLLDPRTGEARWRRSLVRPSARCAIALVSETKAAVLHELSTVLIDLATGDDAWPAPVKIPALGALAASHDGRFLALVQQDAVVLLDAATGEVLSRAVVAGSGDALTSVAFVGDELFVGRARGPIVRLRW